MITYLMSRHTDFIGQRADKVSVSAGVSDDGSFQKEVEHYTITCPECDGDGYYDYRGDVICENCQIVIGGEPVIPTEHGPDNSEAAAEGGAAKLDNLSRGVGPVDQEPFYEPSTQEHDER